MRKIFLFSAWLFFIYSCNWGKNGINLKIKNSSESSVYDVLISTKDPKINLKIKSIKSGETVTGFLDMTNNVKSDGNYLISFKKENGQSEKMSGGYYTNGGSLDYIIICEIKNDTILMDFK